MIRSLHQNEYFGLQRRWIGLIFKLKRFSTESTSHPSPTYLILIFNANHHSPSVFVPYKVSHVSLFICPTGICHNLDSFLFSVVLHQPLHVSLHIVQPFFNSPFYCYFQYCFQQAGLIYVTPLPEILQEISLSTH